MNRDTAVCGQLVGAAARVYGLFLCNANHKGDAVTTLKEFEDELRKAGIEPALAVLERLRARDRATRSLSPVRRVTGRKMTPEIARRILELHRSTKMTQQEIAFQLGINQGRVNEVVKRGKWLTDNPSSPEAVARSKALARARSPRPAPRRPPVARKPPAQLGFDDF